MVGKSERVRLLLMENMVGRLFHKVQHGVEDIRNTWARAAKQEAVPTIRLPFVWWFVYAAAAAVVWAVWPDGKELPAEVWIGVLSFEGLLAALLASVAPASIYEGVVPSTVAFWAALDANIGRNLKDHIRSWREDPTQGTGPGPFRNAFVVALNSLFLLPLIVVLDSRWAAAILTSSLIWTARRIVSDAFPFFLPEYATALPRVYWVARSWHESLSYCPVCNGKPHSVAWPPPREGSESQGSPET